MNLSSSGFDSLFDVRGFLGLVCQVHTEVEEQKELVVGQLRQ
jgi:hypothetical protein